MTDTKDAPKPADPPKPMPFAFMRNSHEALRASIQLQARALEAKDHARFSDEWRSFQRALAVHMAIEDVSMFPLLDGVSDGAATKAKLPDEHVVDKQLAGAVDKALAGGDHAAIAAAWAAWRTDHLHHLEHEEEVMMPLTMKTAPTPDGRARVVHERLVSAHESLPDFDWYVGWVVRLLAEHGSTAQPANVATRVFAWGLQHACSKAQWARLRPIVERSCGPALWAELTAGFGLDGDGKIG